MSPVFCQFKYVEIIIQIFAKCPFICLQNNTFSRFVRLKYIYKYTGVHRKHETYWFFHLLINFTSVKGFNKIQQAKHKFFTYLFYLKDLTFFQECVLKVPKSSSNSLFWVKLNRKVAWFLEILNWQAFSDM